jgi:hypothetical protein
MLRDLDVPFLDAAADQLVWRLGAPPRPALAALQVSRLDGLVLDVRLLGASHQVLVRRAGPGDDGRVACSELVACEAAVPGDLPAAARRQVDRLDYRFVSSVQQVEQAELADLAGALRARATRPSMLVGSFPGSPHAVTAVEVLDTGWRTWHLYPQAGEVVLTETALEVRP